MKRSKISVYIIPVQQTFHQGLRCLVIRRPYNVQPWATMVADEAIHCKTIYSRAMRHFIRVYAVCEAGLCCLRSRRFFNPQLYRSIDEESNQNLDPSPQWIVAQVRLTVSLLAATFVVC